MYQQSTPPAEQFSVRPVMQPQQNRNSYSAAFIDTIGTEQERKNSQVTILEKNIQVIPERHPTISNHTAI